MQMREEERNRKEKTRMPLLIPHWENLHSSAKRWEIIIINEKWGNNKN